jgi:hypothetical protein
VSNCGRPSGGVLEFLCVVGPKAALPAINDDFAEDAPEAPAESERIASADGLAVVLP